MVISMAMYFPALVDQQLQGYCLFGCLITCQMLREMTLALCTRQ